MLKLLVALREELEYAGTMFPSLGLRGISTFRKPPSA